MRRPNPLAKTVLLAGAAALVTSACLQEGGESSSSGGSSDETVEIMYAFTGDQSNAFQESVRAWAEKEGITIKFSSTPDFDKLVRSRVAGNNLPDIAIFPQPGITLDIAKSGKLADLASVTDLEALRNDIVPGILDAATDDAGKVYAAPFSISVKSLVWYPKPAFEAAGGTAPKSLAELVTLTNKLKGSGVAPWCVGIESQAATGWPATDWFEDYVLRLGGTDGYDKWVKHEIPFNDPLVKQAGEQIGQLWFTDGNVLGGRKAITSTNFATAGNPMFTDPPGCLMHRQASFLAQAGNFPQEVVDDLDNRAGVFPLPPAEADGSQPIMGGGDLAGIFNSEDPNAVKVLEFITSAEVGDSIAPKGGFISPHKDFAPDKYPNQTMRDIAQIAYTATDFRFDGSDSMPGEVGSGSFWRESVAWVNGKSLDESLAAIEASWPKS